MNCYIFDVDGTLIDSSGVYLPALQQMLDEYGYAHTPEMLKTAFGMTGRQGLRYFGIPEEQHDEFMHRWESLAYENLLNVKIYDGILDTLHALREGGSKLGIVTSRTRAQFRDGVKPLGLDRYFDTVVCSDEVAHPKPAPDAALECLQRLGCAAGQAVYIGDSGFDMQCARFAGIRSVLALWGCHEPEKIESDLRFAHPAEILNL